MKNTLIIRRISLFLLFFTGTGAITAGFGLISDPSGKALGMTTDVLPASLFSTYLIPGLFLFSIIGFGHITCGLLLLKNTFNSWIALVLSGIILMSWITIQIMMIGFLTILQPLFLLIGLAELTLGFLWKKERINQT